MKIVHITDAFDKDIIPIFNGIKQTITNKINTEEWRSYFSSLKIVLLFDEEFMKQCNHKEIRFKVTLTTKESEDKLQIWNTTAEVTKAVKNDSDNIHYEIIQKLKEHFLKEILKKATPYNIANYFYAMYKRFYPSLQIHNCGNYKKLVLYNWNFGSKIHAFTTKRINVIFPLRKSLHADTIKDDTEDNMKIIITNSTLDNMNDHFVGFDQIIGFDEILYHLFTQGFIDDINFYKEVTLLNSNEIFAIFDLLNKTGHNQIYAMQRELLDLPESDGPILEDYVGRFLTVCFSNFYEEFDLKRQVENQKAIRIRDFIIYNKNPNSIFLKDLRHIKNVENLLFDAKNYAGKLSVSDLDTFQNYVKETPSFGNFGIILSRHGLKENAEDYFVDLLGRQGIEIIVLNQDDMLQMLNLLNNGKDPISVIEEKHKHLVVQL